LVRVLATELAPATLVGRVFQLNRKQLLLLPFLAQVLV
jgi:hypothetical protein